MPFNKVFWCFMSKNPFKVIFYLIEQTTSAESCCNWLPWYTDWHKQIILSVPNLLQSKRNNQLAAGGVVTGVAGGTVVFCQIQVTDLPIPPPPHFLLLTPCASTVLCQPWQCHRVHYCIDSVVYLLTVILIWMMPFWRSLSIHFWVLQYRLKLVNTTPATKCWSHFKNYNSKTPDDLL